MAVTTHTGIIIESLPVLLAPGWLFHHTEQDWKLHEDLFQDACVNHNGVDADNDPITSMHTPLSKSSAEGNNIQDHGCRNCNSLLDYRECQLFCLFSLQLLMNYMSLLIDICVAEISTLNVLLYY